MQRILLMGAPSFLLLATALTSTSSLRTPPGMPGGDITGRAAPVRLAAAALEALPVHDAPIPSGMPVLPTYQPTMRHGSFLPAPTARLVSGRFRHVLSFVLAYLQATPGYEGVGVMISGGYVRDILLGRKSDDLDLTLDLRSCAEGVTVDQIVEGMPDYADLSSGRLSAVESVEIVTAMSETSRSKAVDAAQVKLRIGGEDVLLDLMPTIAREVYDAHDRIPFREGRGTPRQDTLRRDLSIGAMLLEVVRVDDLEQQQAREAVAALAEAPASIVPPTLTDFGGVMQRRLMKDPSEVMQRRLMKEIQSVSGSEWLNGFLSQMRGALASPSSGEAAQLLGRSEQLDERFRRTEVGKVVPTARTPLSGSEYGDAQLASSAASGLQFRLLDYHQGLEDLQAGVLRAPYPREVATEAVWESLALDEFERWQLEEMLQPAGASGSGADEAVEEESSRKQVLWWIKSLRDDPLRLVRTLRFAATLGFTVHGSFWRAVPFSVDALRTKVSGPRKVAELRKIAKAGLPPLVDFFELAFSPLPAFGDDVAFGDALFGGPPAEGEDEPERIAVTVGFDGEMMRTIVDALPADLSTEARVGAVLAAAVISCDLRRNGPCLIVGSGLDESCVLAGPVEHLGNTAEDSLAQDIQMAACLEISTAEVTRACAGLCASSPMLQAAEAPLQIASSLLRPSMPQVQHALFAEAASAAGVDSDGVGVDGEEFAALLRMWELLKLDPAQAKRRLEVGHEFVLALLRTRCSLTAERLEERVRLLTAPGPKINGKAVAGLEGVPPHLRGALIGQLHVLCRLRGEAPVFDTTEVLRDYLEGSCGGLLLKLQAEWWADAPGGKTRPQYDKKVSGGWLHSG